MIIRPIVLDQRGDRRDVAGVHSGHAGSAAHRGGLVVQVQHSEGEHRVNMFRDGSKMYIVYF